MQRFVPMLHISPPAQSSFLLQPQLPEMQFLLLACALQSVQLAPQLVGAVLATQLLPATQQKPARQLLCIPAVQVVWHMVAEAQV